jgi:pumilio RNA-binding family
VQFVLENGKPTDRQRLVDSVLGRILLLSRHKYASNVCEKAIAAADDTRKWRIVEEMLVPGSDGTIPVSLMMRDQFANYVLQKTLKSVEGPLWDALLDAVLRALIIYRRQPGSHNSKQLTSIERLLKEKGVAPEKLVTPRLVVPIPAAQADPNSGSPTP